MGTDAADLDNSGIPSVVVTNFSGEMLGLYTPTTAGHYEDRAAHSEIGTATRLTLGFGCFFFDADLDGLLDLLVVNGHIDEGVRAAGGRVEYAEAPHLFHNAGGRLVDVARQAGSDFAAPKVGRGAAFADIDLDGDLDVLVTTNGGPARLYRNRVTLPNRAIRIGLRGTKSNRDGIGAIVRVRVGSSWLTRLVRTGSSYLSQSELPLTAPRRTTAARWGPTRPSSNGPAGSARRWARSPPAGSTRLPKAAASRTASRSRIVEDCKRHSVQLARFADR